MRRGFCILDSVTIENTETTLMQTFELYTSSKEKAKIEVYSLVKGWIARDARIIPDKKTLFADVEKSGEVNVSISIDRLDKLFINKSKSIDNA